MQVRRLSGDRKVPRVTALDEEVRRAIRFLLGFLVRDYDEDDAHLGLALKLLDRAHHRRETALHVICAAPIEPVAIDAWRELLLSRGDDVDVTVQGHGWAGFGTHHDARTGMPLCSSSSTSMSRA